MLIPHQLREYPAEKDSIDLYETQNFPYIVMGQGDNQKNNDYSILQDISNAFGITPRIAYEVNEFAFKMLLVSQGAGVTFLPQVCLPLAQLLAPDARIFAIENFPTTRSVLIARKKKAAMSPAANDFWNFALEYYQMPPDSME